MLEYEREMHLYDKIKKVISNSKQTCNGSTALRADDDAFGFLTDQVFRAISHVESFLHMEIQRTASQSQDYKARH